MNEQIATFFEECQKQIQLVELGDSVEEDAADRILRYILNHPELRGSSEIENIFAAATVTENGRETNYSQSEGSWNEKTADALKEEEWRNLVASVAAAKSKLLVNGYNPVVENKPSLGMKNALRSIGAVLAGFFTVAILSVVTDAVLEGVGILPTAAEPEKYVTWMLALALFYRSVYTVAGGYVTAYLAKNEPMKHVYALMVLGGIGGVLGAIGGWNLSANWYPVLLAITGPLFVWVGGKMFMSRSK